MCLCSDDPNFRNSAVADGVFLCKIGKSKQMTPDPD